MSTHRSTVQSATVSEHADRIEHEMMEGLDFQIARSIIYMSEDADPTKINLTPSGGKPYLMGPGPRLQSMPAAPTLLDFFKYRFPPANHLLQSARHALIAGHNEKVILACLLHDIAIYGFIRGDHGYWGEQMIAPYVDEEVSWAIRSHQALRFFPDLSVGYEYPEVYLRYFGDTYEPEPYIKAEYERARNHRWYMTSRLICLNDIYSFDPSVIVTLDDFADIIGRNFRQPKEGLGYDNTTAAHVWRTIIAPRKFL